jgi:hypothetical protein
MRTEASVQESLVGGSRLARGGEDVQRRGTSSGLEKWLLVLMREEGHEPRRVPEPTKMHVALRDLRW